MTGENPASRTAVGPMVLAAVERYEPPGRRLMDDDLASSFLPAGSRALVRLARPSFVRRVLGAAPASVRFVPLDFECDDLPVQLARHGYRSADPRSSCGRG